MNDRQEAEKALRENAESFRLLLDRVSNIAVQGYGPDGTVRFWNKASEQIYGYSREEAIGRNLVDLIIPPKMRPFVRDAIRNMIETGEGHPAEELGLMRKDGSIVPVYSNYTVVDVGRGKELYCIDIDLTPLKKAEETVLASERHFRSLFENMLEGFAYCRMLFEDGLPRDFVYLEVNRSFERLTGLKDVIGKKVSDVIPGILGSDPELIGTYGRVAQTGRPESFEIQIESMGKWFSVSAYCPEQDYFVSVFDDISERKQMEEMREATVELLNLCNRAESMRELMRSLMGYFRTFTGCEAVGVRLKKGVNFPYYETRGFPEDFVQAENSLCAIDQAGELVRDNTGHPALDCMCGNILCGRFDPAKPFFSARGSFWSSSTTELLASTTDADRQAKTRNRCNGEGYESVALIPLRLHDEIFGLFQFNDHRPGRFTAKKIVMLEDLVGYVAIALAKLKTDDALREAYQFNRQVIDSAAGGVIVHGADLCYQVWNQFMEQLSGISPDEVIGRHPLEVFPVLRDLGVFERLERSVAGQLTLSVDFPYYFPRTGRSGWFSDAHALIRDSQGEIIGVIVTLTDITKRKRGEERIEHLNRVLRALRAVDQLILREKDPRIFIDETCKVLVEHRGYSGAFIILTHEAGSTLAFAEASQGGQLHPLAENLRQGLLPPCCEKAHMREGAFHVADRAIDCAGCPIAATHTRSDSLCICLRHEGTSYGYLVVLVAEDQTIDEEEEALFCDMAGDVAFALHTLEQNRTMQRMLEERDQIEAELRHAQKMEAVGRLAGGVAHDFNNMLGVIIGYADLALERLNSLDPLHGSLLQIQKAALRSADLTRQLLAFSRKQVIAPQIVNLNNVIEDHRKMLGRLIGEDINLASVPGAGLWNIRMDPSQIDQILANLAVNSRDAISGVGGVTIETANVTLDGSSTQIHQIPPGDYVLLTFGDTGSGMDPDTAERIFEPFFTTKGEGKGTGLGLSTVYGIIKQNDGAIQVTSSPGGGTTFSMYLPRWEGELSDQLAKPADGQREGTETVLIVEDEGQLLDLVRAILGSHGYTVLAAASPGDACLVCEKYPGDIHLMLSDVVMPTMNGKELQARIERMKPGIRTLFMSGYTTDVVVERGIIDRGVNFIHKPFMPDLLVEKVREVLNEGSAKAPRSHLCAEALQRAGAK